MDDILAWSCSVKQSTASACVYFTACAAWLIGSNLELLQFEAEVDQFDHSVLLSLRVLWQLQDQLFTLFYGKFQLFNVRRIQWALKWSKTTSTRGGSVCISNGLTCVKNYYTETDDRENRFTIGLEKWSSARPKSMVRSKLLFLILENSSGLTSEERCNVAWSTFV